MREIVAMLGWLTFLQGVTKRKEKSKSNFCHEIVIKWLFWTQVIVSHIHPFTMTTITHHQCLFIEPMEDVLKNPELLKRENYWNIWEKWKINFSLHENISWNSDKFNEKRCYIIHFFQYLSILFTFETYTCVLNWIN